MSPPPYITIPLHTAHYILWFDLFAPKNNLPTTIYHYSTAHGILHTASTGLTFCTKDNVSATIYHYSTAYCVLWFDLFAPKTMSPPPYTTILLHTAYCILHTASSCWTFLYQRQCPHHHIPLFYYVHCILRPHHRVTFV